MAGIADLPAAIKAIKAAFAIDDPTKARTTLGAALDTLSQNGGTNRCSPEQANLVTSCLREQFAGARGEDLIPTGNVNLYAALKAFIGAGLPVVRGGKAAAADKLVFLAYVATGALAPPSSSSGPPAAAAAAAGASLTKEMIIAGVNKQTSFKEIYDYLEGGAKDWSSVMTDMEMQTLLVNNPVLQANTMKSNWAVFKALKEIFNKWKPNGHQIAWPTEGGGAVKEFLADRKAAIDALVPNVQQKQEEKKQEEDEVAARAALAASDAQAQAEAEEKAQAETQAQAQAEAEEKAKQETQAQAQAEADAREKAKQESGSRYSAPSVAPAAKEPTGVPESIARVDSKKSSRFESIRGLAGNLASGVGSLATGVGGGLANLTKAAGEAVNTMRGAPAPDPSSRMYLPSSQLTNIADPDVQLARKIARVEASRDSALKLARDYLKILTITQQSTASMQSHVHTFIQSLSKVDLQVASDNYTATHQQIMTNLFRLLHELPANGVPPQTWRALNLTIHKMAEDPLYVYFATGSIPHEFTHAPSYSIPHQSCKVEVQLLALVSCMS